MSEKAAIKIKMDGKWVAVPVILSEGISPAVEVVGIEGGHRVTITDKDGSKSFDVMDGAGGEVEIPNSNIVNGEKVGSVRTVGSAENSKDPWYSLGEYSFTEGYGTKAEGNFSHAEGYETKAYWHCAHAEGNKSEANSYASHAEGEGTCANCDYQHVQGRFNVEDFNERYAHIVGNGANKFNRSNAHTLDWQGNGWFAGDVYVGGVSQDDGAQKLMTKAEMQAELQAYVNESILGGAW